MYLSNVFPILSLLGLKTIIPPSGFTNLASLDTTHMWVKQYLSFCAYFFSLTFSRFIHVSNDGISLFLKVELFLITLCTSVYTSHFIDLFLCQWTLGLILCLDWSGQCCNERGNALILLTFWFHFIFRYISSVGIARSDGSSIIDAF